MYLFSVYLKSVYLQHPSGRCQTVLPQPGGSPLWRVKDSRGGSGGGVAGGSRRYYYCMESTCSVHLDGGVDAPVA